MTLFARSRNIRFVPGERERTVGERLREWIAESTLSQRAFAGRCGVAPPRITEAIQMDKVPSAQLREAIERETHGAIRAAAWLESPKRRHSSPPPRSDRHPGSSDPIERLERTLDEHRAELDLLETDGARASMRATIQRSEVQLAEMRLRAPIDRHPAYGALVADLADAALEVYGAEKLEELAEAIERRQAARGESNRRAA